MSFQGAFRFTGGKKLDDNQYRYLLLFWQVERYQRDVDKMENCPDPIRELVGLRLGAEGEFFVSSKDFLNLHTEGQVRSCKKIRLSFVPYYVVLLQNFG